MIIDDALIENPILFKTFLVENQVEFFDVGCSSGGSLTWLKRTLNSNGIGFDINLKKLKLADEKSLICSSYNFCKLPFKKIVKQVTFFDMLEHLSSLSEAKKFIYKAVEISQEAVFIKQPFFDCDPQLFSMGLKTYFSHWVGHTNQMTSVDFWVILSELKQLNLIKDFVIGCKGEVINSDDPCLHSIGSKVDRHEYDAIIDPPKVTGLHFNFKVYKEINIFIDVSGNFFNRIFLENSPSTIIFDSRSNATRINNPSQGSMELDCHPPKNTFFIDGHVIQNPCQIPLRTGRQLSYFIRDDDFTKFTTNFFQLEEISKAYGSMILAVIPSLLDIDTGECDRLLKNFIIAQHGYSHTNWAQPSQPKSEFPLERNRVEIKNELLAGKLMLEAKFGPHCSGVFVPPWNHFPSENLDILVDLQFHSYQGFGSKLEFYNTMPKVGYCINFTSNFYKSNKDWDKFIAMCTLQINNYIDKFCHSSSSQIISIPINTHHLMMDKMQFIFFERLMSFLSLNGIGYSSADDAIMNISKYNDFLN